MTPCQTCDAARDGRCYTAAERQPIVTEYEADGVWVAHVAIPDQGTRSPQHAHAYEHLTMLAAGSVRVTRDDAPPCEYTAPAGIVIPAAVRHLFETLTPNVVLACVHNVARSGLVEILEAHKIVEAA